MPKFILMFIFGLFFLVGTASALDQQFNKAAERTQVPVDLLKAICTAESGLNPRAHNPDDPGYGAFGICQVLDMVAERYLGPEQDCKREWRHGARENIYKNCKWFGPYTNMYVAGRVLSFQLRRYEGNIDAAVAAYNMGTARQCLNGFVVDIAKDRVLYKPSKWGRSSCWKTVYDPVTGKRNRVFQEGKFLNQKYVDRVRGFLPVSH